MGPTGSSPAQFNQQIIDCQKDILRSNFLGQYGPSSLGNVGKQSPGGNGQSVGYGNIKAGDIPNPSLSAKPLKTATKRVDQERPDTGSDAFLRAPVVPELPIPQKRRLAWPASWVDATCSPKTQIRY